MKYLFKGYELTRKVRNLLRFGTLVVLFVGLGGLIVWWLKTPEQLSIRPANVGAKSFSVGWFTDGLTKGCVWAISSFKPSGWLKVCEKDKRATHLLSLTGVEPDTDYRLILIDGIRIKFKGISPALTKKLSDEPLKNPEPAYGSIVGEDGELVPGALVYIFAKTDQFHYPVATKTNMQGNYAVDISKLKKLSKLLVVETIASAGIWNDQVVSSQYHEPLPSIRVILK